MAIQLWLAAGLSQQPCCQLPTNGHNMSGRRTLLEWQIDERHRSVLAAIVRIVRYKTIIHAAVIVGGICNIVVGCINIGGLSIALPRPARLWDQGQGCELASWRRTLCGRRRTKYDGDVLVVTSEHDLG
jgi:hypothetical protein